MPILPQLEGDLREAATRVLRASDGADASTRRRSGRRVFGAVPALFAVAVSVVIAAIVLVSFHAAGHNASSASHTGSGGRSPSPSGATLPAHPTKLQDREEIYLDTALSAMYRKDAGCTRASGLIQQQPTYAQGAPPAGLLSLLGALRRPANVHDALPVRLIWDHVTHHWKRYPDGSMPDAQGIYRRDIRLLTHRDGANFYLVPAQNANTRRPLPARCYSEQRTQLMRELPTIPASLRAGTLALEPRFLAAQRDAALPYPGVWLLALNASGNGDVGGGLSVEDIKEGRALSSGGPAGVGIVYGLVPDGVRAVTFYYPGHNPGRPLTVPVVNNIFILRDPRQRYPNEGFPLKLVWHNAAGRKVRTVTF